jgi:hypothetical protein
MKYFWTQVANVSEEYMKHTIHINLIFQVVCVIACEDAELLERHSRQAAIPSQNYQFKSYKSLINPVRYNKYFILVSIKRSVSAC